MRTARVDDELVTGLAMPTVTRLQRPSPDEGAAGAEAWSRQQLLFGLPIPSIVLLQAIHALEIAQSRSGGRSPDTMAIAKV